MKAFTGSNQKQHSRIGSIDMTNATITELKTAAWTPETLKCRPEEA